jgi:hypothetical protein
MGPCEKVEFEAARLADLLIWAEANNVTWCRKNTSHHPFHATKDVDGVTRLIGVGRTLKKCLWMAYQMINQS